MIQWNEDNGIKVFRLSSELFPHKTNPKIESYDLDFAKEHLQKVGELAKSYNQRLTFHPGQFNVLATLNKSALKMTLNDLMYHSQVLDMMGLGKDLLWLFMEEVFMVIKKVPYKDGLIITKTYLHLLKKDLC